MHRPDKGAKLNDRKKSPSNRQFDEDYMDEQDPKHGRQGRRQWQQEKQLIKQLDPKAIDEFLLDNE